MYEGRLAKLKYKCLITIVSLLECNDALINKIVRNIPFSVLTKNLLRIYELYSKNEKGKEGYTDDLFGRWNQEDEVY